MSDNTNTEKTSLDIDMLQNEKTALRAEMVSLKNCQITFLTYTVTGTGALLGLAITLVGSSTSPFPLLGAFYLIPLTIILPFWWIFFDKATTITRIVGYYRILEELILEPEHQVKFVGWENALADFRNQYNTKSARPLIERRLPLREFVPRFKRQLLLINDTASKLFQLLLLQTSQRYWLLTYYTFLSLSFLSFSISLISLAQKQAILAHEIEVTLMILVAGLSTGFLEGKLLRFAIIPVNISLAVAVLVYFLGALPHSEPSVALVMIGGFLVGISCSRNLIMVTRLCWGIYSYQSNYLVWRRLLKLDSVKIEAITEREIRLEYIRLHSNNPSLADLRTLLEDYGFQYRNTVGSHYTFSYELGGKTRLFVVPFRRPVKPIYIKQALKVIDQIIQEQDEDEPNDETDDQES